MSEVLQTLDAASQGDPRAAALVKFAAVDALKAELVSLRYFAGFSFPEASEALGIAVPTAKEWWAYARAWLQLETVRNARPIEKE